MQKLSSEEAIIALNTLLVGNEFLECLDGIMYTTLYRLGMKERVNGLVKELEKSLLPIKDLDGIDNDAMYNLMEWQKKLSKQMASIRPENKAVISAVLESYFDNPESVCKKLDINIIERPEN